MRIDGMKGSDSDSDADSVSEYESENNNDNTIDDNNSNNTKKSITVVLVGAFTSTPHAIAKKKSTIRPCMIRKVLQ